MKIFSGTGDRPRNQFLKQILALHIYLPTTSWNKAMQLVKNSHNIFWIATTNQSALFQRSYAKICLWHRLQVKMKMAAKLSCQSCITEIWRQPVWPDWAIYWSLGNFSKPVATIGLPKSPSFLGNFRKGVKIVIFSCEIEFGQLFLIDIGRFLTGHTDDNTFHEIHLVHIFFQFFRATTQAI